MDLDQLRNLIDETPGPTHPELDAQARAWLESYGTKFEKGGDPVTLVVLAVDEDADARVFAVPASELDETAHAQLAAVTGCAFEWHFSADLEPAQHPGALRLLSGSAQEPELIGELIEDLRDEFEDELDEATLETLTQNAGSWSGFAVGNGAAVGPITHVYSATLCM